jgi:plastocyanin
VFANSIVMSANGSIYKVKFNHAGTFPYQCGVHGALMTGVVVVQ